MLAEMRADELAAKRKIRSVSIRDQGRSGERGSSISRAFLPISRAAREEVQETSESIRKEKPCAAIVRRSDNSHQAGKRVLGVRLGTKKTISTSHCLFTFDMTREGNAAIYEQTWAGRAKPSLSYELIRIRRRDGFRIDGRFSKPAEVYPKFDAC